MIRQQNRFSMGLYKNQKHKMIMKMPEAMCASPLVFFGVNSIGIPLVF